MRNAKNKIYVIKVSFYPVALKPVWESPRYDVKFVKLPSYNEELAIEKAVEDNLYIWYQSNLPNQKVIKLKSISTAGYATETNNKVYQVHLDLGNLGEVMYFAEVELYRKV